MATSGATAPSLAIELWISVDDAQTLAKAAAACAAEGTGKIRRRVLFYVSKACPSLLHLLPRPLGSTRKSDNQGGCAPCRNNCGLVCLIVEG